ncbi:hypothetical protein IFM89_029655 [Coptis chinensis]|uniref:Uncharacterized protein n=1 Tax=Coptis chinensis TaxID=261450 RepID=A0A835IEX5_9MAGN|nr:hypothetical protein IFM89_029655 [Coptis chinensis]
MKRHYNGLTYRKELRVHWIRVVSVASSFYQGGYLGRVEEVKQLHEDGELAKLVQDFPVRGTGFVCAVVMQGLFHVRVVVEVEKCGGNVVSRLWWWWWFSGVMTSSVCWCDDGSVLCCSRYGDPDFLQVPGEGISASSSAPKINRSAR